MIYSLALLFLKTNARGLLGVVMRTFVTLIVMIMSLSVSASDINDVTQPIHNMFDGMREHNGDKLLAQFAPSALLQRAGKGGEIKTNDLKKFAEFVSTTDKKLDEKLLAIDMSISDNLASVWTPYVFYLDGKLSHCGVNSFQLVKFDNKWKIVYLIDNIHSGDCNKFAQRHI